MVMDWTAPWIYRRITNEVRIPPTEVVFWRDVARMVLRYGQKLSHTEVIQLYTNATDYSHHPELEIYAWENLGVKYYVEVQDGLTAYDQRYAIYTSHWALLFSFYLPSGRSQECFKGRLFNESKLEVERFPMYFEIKSFLEEDFDKRDNYPSDAIVLGWWCLTFAKINTHNSISCSETSDTQREKDMVMLSMCDQFIEHRKEKI